MTPEVQRLITDFVGRLVGAIRADILASIAVPAGAAHARYSPPARVGAILRGEKDARRKGPIQLCPIRDCKNRAAPVFHMVCADHKHLSKKTIAAARAARRTAKR